MPKGCQKGAKEKKESDLDLLECIQIAHVVLEPPGGGLALLTGRGVFIYIYIYTSADPAISIAGFGWNGFG